MANKKKINTHWFSNLWLVKFFNELRCWFIVRWTYLTHKEEFDNMKIRCDWFGKLAVIINRSVDIELGSEEDAAYLHEELAAINMFLFKMKIGDILAYNVSPLTGEERIDEHTVEYEHGYKVEFTPAYDLDHQYVHPTSIATVLVGGFFFFIFLAVLCSSFSV